MKKIILKLLVVMLVAPASGILAQSSPPDVVYLKEGEKMSKREKSVARKGGKARKARLDIPEKQYDPNTIVYCDALWMRVHEADCPSLLAKDKKKTMTLEQADKEGWRIGESGQSGRDNCCFKGYRRKYPLAVITDDTIVSGNDNPRHVRHLAGCHRYWPSPDHERKSIADWRAEGFKFCAHCVERGPSRTTISDEAWKNLGDGGGAKFVAPEGWEPMAFSPDTLPPKREVDLLVEEVLAGGIGVQELPFEDPVARLEQFVTMRFFFPVANWLKYYKAYRATGDKRILEKLRASARHYNQLSRENLDVAQYKAQDPEGLAYLYSMAASARITLQLARKYPDQVSAEEIAEAEAFLNTIIAVLQPVLEANDNLDPEMGIPQPLADDFRNRAYNRAMNGIGTISMATAALKDLQALKKTQTYQPTIDRYAQTVKAYMDHFKEIGDLNHDLPDQPMFVYPYNGTSEKIVDGAKIYERAEDSGHYSHLLQGLMVIHDSTPELGVDKDFMTAVANAIHYNYTTKISRKGKEEWSGHIQSPTAKRVAPQGGEKVKSHAFSKGPGSKRFYLLEGFRPGVIEALNTTAKEAEKVEAAKENRVEILQVHYVRERLKDPSLIHLGERM